MHRHFRSVLWATLAGAMLLPFPLQDVRALDRLSFQTPGASDDLRDKLKGASLLLSAEDEKTTDPQTLFASARAEYAHLVGALYAEGYYSGVISILIDGKEAADIAPLDAPKQISQIAVSVTPGPQFTFSAARMKPYARRTALPADYRDTLPAKSTAIVAAADAGVDGWRNLGHAKATVAGQSVVADHRTNLLNSEILLDPGPRLRFGNLRVSGHQRMRLDRVLKIAGFPEGEVYSPKELETVAKRLRRTGVFSSVALTESETVGADGTLDVDLALTEDNLRRFGFGAEVSGSEGLDLSGYWLHRNLLGGGERLKFDAAVTRIGGQDSEMGYDAGVRIDRPATPVTDATAFVDLRVQRLDLADWQVDRQAVTFGLTRIFGDTLTAEAAITYSNETATDSIGSLYYKSLSLPVSLTWERRNDPVNAKKGFYLQAGITPFLGFDATGSGAQLKTDARFYRSFGPDGKFVLAARLQAGTVSGSGILQTPPDLLFYSGGGGTVRGQPYQSLSVTSARPGGGTIDTGGASFVGVSGELRTDVTEKIGAVAFYDFGYITSGDFFGGATESHAGAGMGLRYDTGFGPIRFDLALPVSGPTGDGLQIYFGIGQAF
ncbi:MAG: autotransporter assembly complex protein TamA [Proteobacteria bacterium]|nr:autotransporter assembly complex protein TamA [Pseudomonadota bacterium]